MISHLLIFSFSEYRVFAGLVEGSTTTGTGRVIFIMEKYLPAVLPFRTIRRSDGHDSKKP